MKPHAFVDELVGAKVEDAQIVGELLVIEFAHHGTDDGSVRITIPADLVMLEVPPWEPLR